MKLPKVILMRTYPTLIGVALAFGTPALCLVAARAFGELCWPQRIGAVYVGVSVIVQGYLAADRERFRTLLSDGNSLGRHINQFSFTLAAFGTFFAAFGDLLPPSYYYGVAMCPP